MRVLLTDGDQRSTLAAVRALGAAGMEVYVGESTSRSLASSSRHCRGTVRYPSPYDDDAGFIHSIAEVSQRLGIDLVIPMADITSALLAEHRDSLSGTTRIAVMDAATFWRASDKNALFRLAETLDVPTPTLHYVERPADIARLPEIPFPCIIKPGRSRLLTEHGWIKTSVLIARSRQQLEHMFRTRPELQYPCTLQRQISGDGIGVFALCNRGEPLALFAHRRLREKPPWGGVSVLREAIPLDAATAGYASRLLKALDWHGVAMVEFKCDRTTGTAYLMEVNARFWGSLQLAIDAGINFPVHAVRLWLGEPVQPPSSYRIGIRSRWLLGDLDHLILRLKANGSTPADAPPLGALIWDFLRFFPRNTRYEIESWRDPGPSMYEVGNYVRDICSSTFRSRH